MPVVSVPFKVISCTSFSDGHEPQQLEVQSNLSTGWTSQRFCSWPQELVLELSAPARIRKLQIMSHESKIAKRIDLFANEWKPASLSDGAFSRDIYFRRLGHVSLSDNERGSFACREVKSVHLDVTCTHIRLVLHENHINRVNVYNQVGLAGINCVGEPVSDSILDRLAMNGAQTDLQASDRLHGLLDSLHQRSSPRQAVEGMGLDVSLSSPGARTNSAPLRRESLTAADPEANNVLREFAARNVRHLRPLSYSAGSARQGEHVAGAGPEVSAPSVGFQASPATMGLINATDAGLSHQHRADDLEVTMGVDSATLQKIRRLGMDKEKAVQNEDYLAAARIRKAMDLLTDAGRDLARLERMKREAVMQEQYERAHAIKEELASAMSQLDKMVAEALGDEAESVPKAAMSKASRLPDISAQSRDHGPQEQQQDQQQQQGPLDEHLSASVTRPKSPPLPAQQKQRLDSHNIEPDSAGASAQSVIKRDAASPPKSPPIPTLAQRSDSPPLPALSKQSNAAAATETDHALPDRFRDSATPPPPPSKPNKPKPRKKLQKANPMNATVKVATPKAQHDEDVAGDAANTASASKPSAAAGPGRGRARGRAAGRGRAATRGRAGRAGPSGASSSQDPDAPPRAPKSSDEPDELSETVRQNNQAAIALFGEETIQNLNSKPWALRAQALDAVCDVLSDPAALSSSGAQSVYLAVSEIVSFLANEKNKQVAAKHHYAAKLLVLAAASGLGPSPSSAVSPSIVDAVLPSLLSRCGDMAARSRASACNILLLLAKSPELGQQAAVVKRTQQITAKTPWREIQGRLGIITKLVEEGGLDVMPGLDNAQVLASARTAIRHARKEVRDAGITLVAACHNKIGPGVERQLKLDPSSDAAILKSIREACAAAKS